MTMRANFLHRVLRDAKRLASHEGGIAAVEFAMILPILVLLWLGGVEMTGALSVDRRVNNYASSLGDLVARRNAISYSEIDDIFDLADAAMFPYDATGMDMRVTAIDVDEDGEATVAWSRGHGDMTARAKGDPMTSEVPDDLRVANSQVIMAEAAHSYSPAIGYVLTGAITLDDRMFFVPRLKSKVKICPTDDPASCVDSV
jgi:Flp pilus assembly protein TadG